MADTVMSLSKVSFSALKVLNHFIVLIDSQSIAPPSAFDTAGMGC
jgi:hypothetical protein